MVGILPHCATAECYLRVEGDKEKASKVFKAVRQVWSGEPFGSTDRFNFHRFSLKTIGMRRDFIPPKADETELVLELEPIWDSFTCSPREAVFFLKSLGWQVTPEPTEGEEEDGM